MPDTDYATSTGLALYPWQPVKCRDCPELVVWAFTQKGARMPLNAEPKNNGTILLMKAAEPLEGKLGVLAIVLSGPVLDRARSELARLYTSHHASCPNAKNRRRRKP